MNRPSLPTDAAAVRLVSGTLRTVLTGPGYAALAALGSFVGLSVFVLSQNVVLVRDLVVGGPLPLRDRLEIMVALYPFVGTAYRRPTAAVLVATAVLFGLNLAVLAYHLRHADLSLRGGSGSALGVLLGTMGAGCAACGSVVVSGVFSLFGVTGALALLPLDGLEFALLALVSLSLSIYWLADGMRRNGVEGCRLPRDGAD